MDQHIYFEQLEEDLFVLNIIASMGVGKKDLFKEVASRIIENNPQNYIHLYHGELVTCLIKIGQFLLKNILVERKTITRKILRFVVNANTT